MQCDVVTSIHAQAVCDPLPTRWQMPLIRLRLRLRLRTEEYQFRLQFLLQKKFRTQLRMVLRRVPRRWSEKPRVRGRSPSEEFDLRGL